MSKAEFEYPYFYDYPPYFTLQPVQATQDKQKELWKELILKYCKHHRVYRLSTDAENESPLFYNRSIQRRLSKEARTVFLEALAQQGKAVWLDKDRRWCLLLWYSIPEWANKLKEWAAAHGFVDEVLLLDDLINGDDVRGTELEGIDRLVLLRALKVLEGRGEAKFFQGNTPEEEGVKFF